MEEAGGCPVYASVPAWSLCLLREACLVEACGSIPFHVSTLLEAGGCGGLGEEEEA